MLKAVSVAIAILATGCAQVNESAIANSSIIHLYQGSSYTLTAYSVDGVQTSDGGSFVVASGSHGLKVLITYSGDEVAPPQSFIDIRYSNFQAGKTYKLSASDGWPKQSREIRLLGERDEILASVEI